MREPGIQRSVAIDIETKSVHKDAFILSIGAVAFHDFGILNTFEKTKPCVFYGQVPWLDFSQSQRHILQSTLDWWEHQPEALRWLRSPNSQQEQWVYRGLPELLKAWMEFVKEERSTTGKVIALGIDFDCAILDDALFEYDLMGQKSWRYGDHLCMRAFREAAHRSGISTIGYRKQHLKETLLPHHAADDAIQLANQFVHYNHELWKSGQPKAQLGLQFIS